MTLGCFGERTSEHCSVPALGRASPCWLTAEISGRSQAELVALQPCNLGGSGCVDSGPCRDGAPASRPPHAGGPALGVSRSARSCGERTGSVCRQKEVREDQGLLLKSAGSSQSLPLALVSSQESLQGLFSGSQQVCFWASQRVTDCPERCFITLSILLRSLDYLRR